MSVTIKREPGEEPSASRSSVVVSGLELSVVVLVGVAVLHAGQGAFSFYEDEGINLIKAMLVADGYSLYDQIYSDQAPLFTWLLALPLYVGVPEQLVRAVPILFAAATLCAVHLLATGLGGRWAGRTAVLALLLSVPFLKFGGSLVINTPALALGTWSVVFALRYGLSGGRRPLCLSGVLLGIAAIIKLASLYLVPVVLLALLRQHGTAGWRYRSRELGLWFAMLLAPGLIASGFLPLGQLATQLIRPHTTGLEQFGQQSAEARTAMLLAPGCLWLYFSALLSTGVLAWRRTWQLAPFLCWLAITAAWMLFHHPLWSHHLPDFLVPLLIVCAAGSAVGIAAMRSAGTWMRPVLAVPAGLLVVAVTVQAANHDHWRRWYDNASETSLRAVAAAIAASARPDDWILTDRPALAFWARRRPPPPLALLLRKRIFSGGLTDQDLVHGLEQYRPAVVALCTDRLAHFPAFHLQLARDYRRLATLDTRRLFQGTVDSRCRLHKRTSP